MLNLGLGSTTPLGLKNYRDQRPKFKAKRTVSNNTVSNNNTSVKLLQDILKEYNEMTNGNEKTMKEIDIANQTGMFPNDIREKLEKDLQKGGRRCRRR